MVLLGVLLVGVVAASLAVVAVARHRAAAADCRAWQQALARRTADDVDLVGEGTAVQFRREALASGRIDVAGRTVLRPTGCS